MDFKAIKEKFDSLDARQQYEWLVSTDLKDRFELTIDLNDTEILFNDDDEAKYIMRFKKHIGFGGGLVLLLQSIGIEADKV